MIGYLSGKVLECNDGKLLVGLGSLEGSGIVGYSVTVPHSPSYGLLHAGNRIELFIYTHVKEDALDLFGFSTRAEKELFLTLLGVNGIGPKGAMAIISAAEAGALIQAIVKGDKPFLNRIPGIGKKTAERMILELADPIRKKYEAGVFFGTRGSGSSDGSGAKLRSMDGKESSLAMNSPINDGVDTHELDMLRDATAALVGLGYRDAEIGPLLNQALSGAENMPAKTEDLIKAVLKQLV